MWESKVPLPGGDRTGVNLDLYFALGWVGVLVSL